MKGERSFVVYVLVPAFFFLVMFYVYPTLFNLVNSFTDLSLFGLKQGGEWIGFANYVELLTSSDFRHVLWNTAFWLTFVSVTVRIVLGLLLALLLNCKVLVKYRLTSVSRVLLLVPWATPPIVAIVAWRWLLNPQLGEINKVLLWLGVIDRPISFLASLQSLPSDLIEAAEVDGAGKWQRLRYVILPHLKPAIIVMTLMSTFWTFNNFVYVWLTTAAGPGLYTNVMATEVYIKAFIDGRMGYSSAVGIAMASIMVLFGLLYLRLIAERQLKEAF
jgi:multiple sugar transport system permease protein